MPEIKEQIQEQIQELQSIEQNLQLFLQQKQAFQVELNESVNALSELENTKDPEAFKIISGIMVKTPIDSLKKDLDEKKNLLQERVKAIERQESLLEKKSVELRENITKEMSSQENKDESK